MKRILSIITIIFAYQFAMFIYGHQWLTDLLPTGDFAGSVAVVAELKQILTSGHLPNWSSLRFCGSPNTMLWSFLDWLVYVPFAFIFEPVMAVKVGSLFFFGLAGASMFALCFYYCRRVLVSLWAGMAYMISSIFMFSAVHTGHTNFPPYYALQPLTFLALWRLSEKPDRKRLFLAALAIMLAVWTDTERAFSSLPFVFAFIVAAGLLKTSTVFDRQLLRNQVVKSTWLAVSGLIAILLGAFFLVPIALEKGYIALFSEEVLADSRAIFGLNNLLYLVDRDGWLVGKLAGYLPDRDCYDAGNYYLGISTVLLLLTVCLARNKRDNRVRFVWIAIVICICMIWTASGTTSIYNNLSTQMTGLYKHLRYANEHPYLLPSVSIGILVIIGLFCYLRAKFSCPSWSLTKIAISVGFLLVVSYTAIFPLLAHLPLYSHMRNPGFFMSALPPLLIVLAGTLLITHFTETLGKVAYTLVIVAVTVLTLADYGAYRTGFSRQVSPQLVRDFHDASIVMKNHPSPGRYLSRESYSPLADMHASYTDRDSAWYWLNWSCPKGTHHAFMNRIYPQLHHPDTIEQALALAGLFNVRFITYNLTEGPHPPPTESLKQVFAGETYAVYENLLCRDYVQLYEPRTTLSTTPTLNDLISQETLEHSVNCEKSESEALIELDVNTEHEVLLVLSQSHYPGWSLTIDNRPATLHTIEDMLPAIVVPAGSHHITFRYKRPWYFHTSLAVSIVTLLFAARGALCRKKNRFPATIVDGGVSHE